MKFTSVIVGGSWLNVLYNSSSARKQRLKVELTGALCAKFLEIIVITFSWRSGMRVANNDHSEGSKAPKNRVCRVPVAGIVVIIVGKYFIFGCLTHKAALRPDVGSSQNQGPEYGPKLQGSYHKDSRRKSFESKEAAICIFI